jgi:hypothetical protein
VLQWLQRARLLLPAPVLPLLLLLLLLLPVDPMAATLLIRWL